MARVPKPGKHTFRLNASARQTAQMLLLKPTMRRLLHTHVHSKANLEGLETPYVVFANHSSHLDTPLIYRALPNRVLKYLAAGAAHDYFYDKWWRVGPASLFFNGYPINRDKGEESKKRNVKDMPAALLDTRVLLLIYPKGLRSRVGAVAPFKPSVTALCTSRQIPAVPIALIGAHAAQPSSQEHLPKGRPVVHAVIGRPLRLQPGEIAHKFNERMHCQMLELHGITARAYGARTFDEYT